MSKKEINGIIAISLLLALNLSILPVLYGNNDINSVLFGILSGWFSGIFGSFLVSLLFYLLVGQKINKIRKPFSNDVVEKITSTLVGFTSTNKNIVEEEAKKASYVEEQLKDLFPLTYEYIITFESSTFYSLNKKYIMATYLDFATHGNTLCYLQELKGKKLENAKKVVESKRNKFFKEVRKRLELDIFEQ